MADQKSSKRSPRFKDISGQKYGRLTAVSFSHGSNNHSYWNWACDCGNQIITSSVHVKRGATKSCGCLNKESAQARFFKHGLKNTREYNSWRAAKNRCYQPTGIGYKNYGGRGIVMCEEWKDSFNQFLEDMGPCPEGMTLERLDTNGPYSPQNCAWKSRKEQARNKRYNLKIKHEGKEILLVELAEQLGISYGALLHRHKTGLDLTAPPRYKPFRRSRNVNKKPGSSEY